MFRTHVRPRLLLRSYPGKNRVRTEVAGTTRRQVMASGGAASQPPSPSIFLQDPNSPTPDMDEQVTVGVVPPSQQQQVATQTQLESVEGDVDAEDISVAGSQVTAQVVVSSSNTQTGVVTVVNNSHSLSSSPVSAVSTDSPSDPNSQQQTQYIAVTVSGDQSTGVVVTSDNVAQSVHPAYVQYVDDTSPEAATIYATTNGQMAYPVYTMGEATATMYTPAASGQYYTASNQSTATYTQGQAQLLGQAPSAATYILQQGVDGSEAHAMITTNRASPPTVSAETAAAVAAAVGYMVPTGGSQCNSQDVTNNSNIQNDQLDDESDSGGPSSLSNATRVSPATVQWLVENYETAEGVSLPRSTLYNHYIRHCTDNKLDPVNAASFGKLIRSVFIGLRTRRLGTRGNSKYHYYGIRVKPTSPLSQFDDSESSSPTPTSSGGRHNQNGGNSGNTTPNKRFNKTIKNQEFETQNPTVQNHASVTNPSPQLSQHHQFLGEASAAIPMFPVIDFTGVPLPDDCTYEDVDTLRSIYREHCEAFLDAVVTLEFSTVESLWREFWRSSDNNNGDECEEEKYLSKTKLYLLCKCAPVQVFVRKVDFDFYQNLVEVLIPDVLRPIPSSLTQAIRNFAKGLEGWLTGAMTGCPEPIMNIKLCAVSAFAQTLRRYTSLNHLAQAARAVLQNSTQINQMLADLNRVDFHNVQEQASWVCQCDSSMVQRLEADFKSTLQQQNSLEQWADWLKNVVNTVLKPYEGKPNFAKAARQFLLKWSFYSSMVIRDLTLRSAASFGSFHLIRLLYDEYMFFLIEHQVAAATGETPIAVIGEKKNTVNTNFFNLSSDDEMDAMSCTYNTASLSQCNGESSTMNQMNAESMQQHLINAGKVQISSSTSPTLRSDASKRLKMS